MNTTENIKFWGLLSGCRVGCSTPTSRQEELAKEAGWDYLDAGSDSKEESACSGLGLGSVFFTGREETNEMPHAVYNLGTPYGAKA